MGAAGARRRALGLLALAALACSGGETPARALSPEALAERLQHDPQLVVLDVRSPEEYAAGHVPGARNVPHTEIPARLEALRPFAQREVVVYCERGGRAARAERLLREAGFERVRHLEGDMAAWRARALPQERAPAPGAQP